MVTNNKVLTVSYGTFACTLEGFDESFEAMKAIAEYFRDLAADDRYFGAEPPTPDAEMLTRIAEREIERRVQARTEAGAIVLSAAPAEAPASEQPVADAPVETNEAPAEVETPDDASPVDDVITDVMADVSAATAMEDAPEAAEDTVADQVDAIVEEASVEEAIEEIAEDATEDTPEDTENLFEEAYDSLSAADDVIEAQANDADDIVNVAQATGFADPDEAPAEDSIAAKLRRIRAVVSTQEDAPAQDDFIEDQHAEEIAAPTMEGFDAPEEAPLVLDTPEMVQDEDIADLDLEEDDLELEQIAETVAEAPVAPVARKPRARVIRMKRAEFEDAIENGMIEEDDSLDIPEAASAQPEPIAPTSLSRDDEDELLAELSAVDAELGLETVDLDTADLNEAPAAPEIEDTQDEETLEELAAEVAPVAPVRPRRARRKLVETPAEDDAVDRLLAEANTKLDEPEGKGRRSAIAHLRAAVAATKAEKDAGSTLEKEDNSDAYRADLADAVRPRKTKTPLKLVAEQRVDEPEDAVRPRRVEVQDTRSQAQEERMADFVEFAESQEATQLPEVLEAAASFLTFVEGRPRFSRPMLMRLAYQVGDEPFEREAGLRSFGQLLRDKKIEKIAGGRFTASEAISFKPTDRAAG